MANTDSEEKTKSDVYRERNLNALAFISAVGEGAAFARDTRVEAGWWPDTDDVNGEEWAVVWVDLPLTGIGNVAADDDGVTKQVAWHVPMEMVPDWMPKRDPEYDGYSTEEKNDRLREYISTEDTNDE